MKEVALITGVSRPEGLGYEAAKQMLAAGFEVILTARNSERAEQLAEQLGGATGLLVDITDQASIDALQYSVEDQYGRLDVLINNAGAFFDQGVQPLDVEMDFALQALDTNFLGAWRMIKAFYPLLSKAQPGRIVNVSSGAGSFRDPVFGLDKHSAIVPAYSISKLALNGLTVKLARQFKEQNIKINSVCPGFVATYPGTAEWGARPVSEGVKGVVWAAQIGQEGPSGGFFRDGEPIEW